MHHVAPAAYKILMDCTSCSDAWCSRALSNTGPLFQYVGLIPMSSFPPAGLQMHIYEKLPSRSALCKCIDVMRGYHLMQGAGDAVRAPGMRTTIPVRRHAAGGGCALY